MDTYYPRLPETAVSKLATILQLMEQDPEFLDGSPYSQDELDVLRGFASRQVPLEDEEDEEEVDSATKWARLEKESNKLFKMLTNFSSKLDTKDNTETMAYFRTATSLLDKIVGIQERAANLKQINMFHHTVLSVMEDVLEPGQRTAVMDRLRNAIKPE